ncbi:hypothetical protein N2152v2_005877 [Parachlorella kessleri]
MVEYKEGERKSVKGLRLFTVEYHPSTGQPKAALVFHHGLGEYIGRYEDVFNKLANSGIAVYAEDCCGHGKSEGERALILDFNDLVEDFAGLGEHARHDLELRYGAAPPMFLGGHSLGTLVSCMTCLRDQERWAGLILIAPAMDVDMSLSLRIQAAVGNILAHILPRAHVVKAVRPEDMSADPAFVQEYIDDPMITKGPLAASTANEIIKAFTRLRPKYGAFTLPIYATHGDADKCTSFPATCRFIEGVASKDKTLKAVPGGYHESSAAAQRAQQAQRKGMNAKGDLVGLLQLILGPGTEPAVEEVLEWIVERSKPTKM